MYSGGGKQTGKGTTYSRASDALSSKAASAAGGQRSSLKPGIRGRVSILGWNRYQSAHDRVLMNVLAMMREILRVTNAMVRNPRCQISLLRPISDPSVCENPPLMS